MFYNDNLVWIDIVPDEGYNIMDRAEAEAYFEKLYDQIWNLEGRADVEDRDWTVDEYGSEAWEAHWYREDYDISIMVEMHDDGTMSNLTITISGLFEE